MARVIKSSLAEFNNMQYGAMSRESYDYIQHKLNTAVNSGIFGNNSAFVDSVQQTINQHAYASVVLAETSLEGSRTMFEDGVFPMRELRQFTSASLYNQQYLAACPVISREIQSGTISGWGETLPENFYDTRQHEERYREVMDGQVLWSDENPDGEDVFKVYFAEEFCSNPLRNSDKIIMRQNWVRLNSLVFDSGEEAKDPTDQFGGML